MRKVYKSFLKAALLLVTVAVALNFAGCSKQGETMKKIKESGKLVLGTSADYAPYEFHKIIDGQDTIVGFDIDIAREIAKDLGVELVINEYSFDSLLQALNSGKIDIVISGMNPSPERAKSVDFSDIYYTAQHAVMVRAEDKDKIKTIDDLKGKKVGAQLTTTQEDIVKEKMPDSTLVSLKTIPNLVLELMNKKVDAIVVELPVAKGYVKNNSGLAISDIDVNEDISEEESGNAVAVRKNNKDLVEQINKTIARIQKDGTLDKYIAQANEMNEIQDEADSEENAEANENADTEAVNTEENTTNKDTAE